MTGLYETLLPRLQAINEEGGNFSAFHLSHPVLNAIDEGAAADPNLAIIRRKILKNVAAHQGKRDHLGFNQIFEAYSEGVIYLAATRRQGVPLRAVDDGAKHGKTPDFATEGALPVGLEVKTVNVFDPARTIDAAMDRGFEGAYAATEEARARAARTGKVGVGFAEVPFAPHGDDVDAKGAVEQTIKKIRGLVKAGQYAARPTLLVVSMVRLGVHQAAVHLRRRLDVDEDCGLAPNGHLFAIAANRLGDPYFDYSHHKWFGVADAGPLSEAGVLIDRDEIAGMVFLETRWNKSGDPDAIESGFRFHGIWNADWNPNPQFTEVQRAEARRVFEALCDTWNDTDDARAALIPDLGALQSAFRHLVGQFAMAWRGRTPDQAALAAFMADADRAHFLWKAAEAGAADAAAFYDSPGTFDVQTGRVDADGASVIFVALPEISLLGERPRIPRLHLVKRGPRWSEEDVPGTITGCEIVI